MGEFSGSRSATEDDKKQAVIEGEYAEAVTTARAYLQAVGVLDANGRVFEEDEIRKRRECEDRMMRAAILSVGQPVMLPRDPNCHDAIKLAMRYRRDVDPESLAALLRNQNRHRSYQVALDTIMGWLEATDYFTIPDGLREWDDSGRYERPKGYSGAAATRNHLIGMVVEAMAQGTKFLYPFGDSERGQLQKDLNRIYADAGNPPEGLPTEAVVEALNKLRARPRRDRNDGEGTDGGRLVRVAQAAAAGRWRSLRNHAGNRGQRELPQPLCNTQRGDCGPGPRVLDLRRSGGSNGGKLRDRQTGVVQVSQALTASASECCVQCEGCRCIRAVEGPRHEADKKRIIGAGIGL